MQGRTTLGISADRRNRDLALFMEFCKRSLALLRVESAWNFQALQRTAARKPSWGLGNDRETTLGEGRAPLGTRPPAASRRFRRRPCHRTRLVSGSEVHNLGLLRDFGPASPNCHAERESEQGRERAAAGRRRLDAYAATAALFAAGPPRAYPPEPTLPPRHQRPRLGERWRRAEPEVGDQRFSPRRRLICV